MDAAQYNFPQSPFRAGGPAALQGWVIERRAGSAGVSPDIARVAVARVTAKRSEDGRSWWCYTRSQQATRAISGLAAVTRIHPFATFLPQLTVMVLNQQGCREIRRHKALVPEHKMNRIILSVFMMLMVNTMSCKSVRPSLEISSFATEDTGTMHYAEKIEISFMDKQPITIVSDRARGVLAPIIDNQFFLSGSRHLVLGWTSRGGGMQTTHALLVDTAGVSLRLVDTLEIRTDRSSSGFVVDLQKRSPRFGILRPNETQVHNPGEWQLRMTRTNMMFEAIPRLPYECVPIDHQKRWVYDPPLWHKWTGSNHLDVAWFRIEKDGFRCESPSPPFRSETDGSSGTSFGEIAGPVLSPPRSVHGATDPEFGVHRVTKGETLSAIARRYGVPFGDLIRLNDLPNPDLIRVDQKLFIRE